MRRSLKLFLFLFSLLTQFQTIAQSITQREKEITARYTDYFKSDREKIHLHLNKTTYLNEETIWFKGYVIEEKSKKPVFNPTNIYIDLYDLNGTRILSELCYLIYGTFEGYIPLGEKIKSGTYYIRAYTNFMNNFTEDESALYQVTILASNDKMASKNTKPDLSGLNIRFFPEAGVFLENSANTMVIKITDCNEKPVAVQNGSIINNKGDLVTNFATSEKGIGRFELPQNYNAPYKAVFTTNNKTQTFLLPTPKTSGYTFSINNYTFNDKAFLKLKTASPVSTDTALSLIIQQDEKVSLIENLTLKKGLKEDTFTISNEHFYEGINTIVLIDQNNKKLAERLIFKPYSITRKTTLSIEKKQNDSIVFRGLSNVPMGSMSISVVPEKSVATENASSIYDSFTFSAYLENPLITNTDYFFNEFSKNKHYELDTYLITQKPKYDADKILNASHPSVNKYEPESGITIKGTINKTLSDKSKYYVQMGAFYNSIKKQSDINEKNEFLFDNAIMYDSTSVSLTLYNRNTGRTEDLPMSIQILKSQNLFLKPLPQPYSFCPPDPANSVAMQLPNFRDMKAVQLNNVTIQKKPKKPELINARRFHNSMARGYKISSGDFATFREVLYFIGANGFDVIYKGGDVYIFNRISRSLRGNPSPAVFVDDVPLQPDLTMLIGMSLDIVEEIYISKSGYGMGMDGGSGYIRIYTKRYMGTETTKSKAQSYVVKKAAQNPRDFKNPEYLNYDDGFINYGTIFWIPEVKTDQNGNFSFAIPTYKQEHFRIKIEGIGSNGELISEEKVIRL